MRRYTDEDERTVRLQKKVRDWAGAGLLDRSQAAAIDARLRTDLKRTGDLLRGALALFTILIVAASVALLFVSLSIRGDAATSATLAIVGAGCLAAAEFLVGTQRLYRYGVEEVLAVSSAGLLAVAAAAISTHAYRSGVRMDTLAGLTVAAVALYVIYRRFGFVYAAVGSTICAALVPSQFGLGEPAERLWAAAVFAVVFIVMRTMYRRTGDEFPGDEYAAIGAAACAGLYMSLNVHAIDLWAFWLWRPAPPSGTWFYWCTYAATWIVPAAALADAIRAKDRALLAVGIVLAIGTLATNKPYLGQPRQTWDPMLLGVLLAGGALLVRRWLASGIGGQRGGYTSARILRADRDLLAAVANASVAWHERVQQRPAAPAPAPSQFSGGRSGGGGGGAGY